MLCKVHIHHPFLIDVTLTNVPEEGDIAMAKFGIIRCVKSLDQCSLGCCIRCIEKEGVSEVDTPTLAGIVTCHCPGDNVVELATELKAAGAEVICICTCAFSKISTKGWSRENVFCENIDRIVQKITAQTHLQCKKVIAPVPDILCNNHGSAPVVKNNGLSL